MPSSVNRTSRTEPAGHHREFPLSLAAIDELVAEEEAEDARVLHLTANETVLSPRARAVLASPLTSRYLLEHLDMRGPSPARLGNLLLRGLDRIGTIEESATEVCRRLFGARYAEFRCLSGLHAMQTTFAALSRPGDTVMRVATKDGGHFLTELICRSFGRRSCTYVFDDTMTIDLERTREVVEKERPSLLFVDAMNYLFPFPIAELKAIAGDVPLVFDASHTLGLIAGGRFQDPLREGADLLQANTHKTFFGPQKGIILGNDRSLMEELGYTLSTGMVSSQHTASTVALLIALHEMWYDGREYAAQVIDNARRLAGALRDRGVPVVAEERGFTANHMFFVDTRPLGSGPAVIQRLVRAGVSANRAVAFNHLDTIRFGVQEITRRGYDHDDLDEAADLVAAVLLERQEPERIRPRVAELVGRRRTVRYTGDPASAAGPPARERYAPPTAPAGHPARPRWIGVRLTPLPEPVTEAECAGAQRLGRLAGAFPHQIDSSGNVSFTSTDGRLFVTGSGTYIKDLAPGDFVELTGAEGWTLHCRGDGPPSAEAYLHHLLRERVGARYVVHNHCIPGRALETSGALVIPPKEYGSVALAEAVADACQDSQVMYVRRHGLVFWAHSYDECLALIEDVRRITG
ncbi:fluorothreonine transaldolase [Streptantibioticus cattleyicolor]|uniref:Fluorothreonine transaldolase n=2 Tax=Streptantibioticus cattleyicolor TaxID=29303 RepID=4FTAS_STRCT|nr:fluorothreonine transaldolase [Streptantibioticus cattleyicolor]B6VP39.1 RecName: Full=Fluorothreonine transaldolase; AltName: Full=4-fluorothreonine transaldolase; Short=4-FTase [Streptantibioticus cattleyicolor]AEW99371.1 4-fluorothreonine transaldolase [Streptantibioticus cattleyicolor NRRL 8057 = DSM 46488]CAR92347.1 4-fluorothreonine transaldolase [Streptantibioticus cattleyicolor]CCB71588.1 4-fluorothreonine transaldolase [Streptantibioticus cattleyicolor NRRL 8057 = DSM 46488]